jgi:NAD(P)-dependent dehydrogenase (short-subunit alcohol dehydrogenase family)
MELTGAVTLITGGAHRVGRALALGLARAGSHIVVHYNTSDAAAERTATDIHALGTRASLVRADLADTAAAPRVIDHVRSEFGRLDVLINNASRFEQAPIEAIGPAEWDRVLNVNLRAPFFLAQAAAALLRERHGVILNIADLSALQAWPTYAHHAVSKAGLVHLTRVLARAFGPHIRANAIIPGTVLPPAHNDGQEHALGTQRRVVDRPGSPDDVVAAALYLVQNEFVTGQALVVDGGRMLL